MLDVRLDALKKAMQLEKEGMAFYATSRDKASSEMGRNMFEYLRKSEEGHIRRIREIYHALELSGTWPQNPPQADTPEETVKTIFSDALHELQEQQTVNADDIEALRQAAVFEQNGEHFYAKRAEEVTDLFEKNFYTQLAHEEFHHLKAIQDSIQMLEDPQGFFADREHGTMAG
jgi:rubrerythrin